MKKTRKLKYVTPATIAGLGGAIALTLAGIALAPVTGMIGIVASSDGKLMSLIYNIL